jgi:RND superfamily putative drug exporter
VQLKGTVATVKPATLTELKATAKIGEDAGMTVAFGAQVLPDHSFGITTTELFGVIFARIVLIITVGSLLAAGMLLVSALVGVGVGVGIVIEAITELSAFTTVSSSAPSSR